MTTTSFTQGSLSQLNDLYLFSRLFADILNDFAIFLEIIAPSFDAYFRYVVCVAGVCKVRGTAGRGVVMDISHFQSVHCGPPNMT